MVIKDGVNRMGCKYKQYEQSEPIVCKPVGINLEALVARH